jgi:hypothetical protein
MYVEKREQSREAICSPLLGGHQVQAKAGNLAFLADGSRLSQSYRLSAMDDGPGLQLRDSAGLAPVFPFSAPRWGTLAVLGCVRQNSQAPGTLE